MLIYCAHSRAFDFHHNFYYPLRILLSKEHTLIFPHEQEAAEKNSKLAIEQCDLVLAEVSYPSTGLGIELGWADAQGKTILGFYQEGMAISGSLHYVIQELLAYKDINDLSEKIVTAMSRLRH